MKVILGRVLLAAALLVACAFPGANAATELNFRGVSGFLRSLEERVVSEETLWFYRFFGENLHPSQLNMAKDCDYADPRTHQYCGRWICQRRT